MVVALKMHETDADLIQRVLMALVARPEECERVLYGAGVERAGNADVVRALVRIANYVDTVVKAGG